MSQNRLFDVAGAANEIESLRERLAVVTKERDVLADQVKTCSGYHGTLIDTMRERDDARAALSESQISAFRYISEWCDYGLRMNYTEAAHAMLRDIKVHCLAAVSRIERGEPMESTSQLMDVK